MDIALAAVQKDALALYVTPPERPHANLFPPAWWHHVMCQIHVCVNTY